jgi:hypothetical protein
MPLPRAQPVFAIRTVATCSPPRSGLVQSEFCVSTVSIV